MTRAKVARPRYHHGDLKTALIGAATRLVQEKGVEGFSVADAARAAGVSSGAPYRHFADREDLLDHVAAEGFERLSAATIAAMVEHPPGSIDSVVSGGCAYVAFCAGQPELFHLMWGAARPQRPCGVAQEAGARCHAAFIDLFAAVLKANGLGHLDPHAFSTPLWAMVHGFAGLMIGPAEKVPREPEAVRALIEAATRAYFAGSRASNAAAAALTAAGAAAPGP
jgi:AcrR family transcriptional regulator